MDVCRLWTGLLLAGLAFGCQHHPKPPPELTVEAVADDLDPALALPLASEHGLAEDGTLDSRSEAARTQPARPALEWIPLEQFAQRHQASLDVLVSQSDQPRYAVRNAHGTLRLQAHSRLAQWNGTQLWLAYGPRLRGEIPYLNLEDGKKTLSPLLENQGLRLRGRVIVLDPGHGGKDLGTRDSSLTVLEKDLTLDWTTHLQRELASRGWKVVMTRTNDATMSLADRVGVADRAEADLFISLHFNSSLPATHQAGIETYCLTPPGLPSTLVRYGADDVTREFTNNAFDEVNLLLAFRLHQALLVATGGEDRGVKRARFMTVLRDQKRPAILIEGGFLSNPEELRRIQSTEYRRRMATALADGLDALCGGDR